MRASPGIIATNNKSPFYINIRGIKKEGIISIHIESNLEKKFNDPTEKRAVESLISPDKGMINIVIYNILKNEKYIEIDQIVSIPMNIKIYDAKNTKILMKTVKNKGNIITSTYFGELNISTPSSFLSFEISTFSNLKNRTVISIVARGYSRTFDKLSLPQLIEEIKNFAQNIPFNELPKPLYNYKIEEFAFDKEKDIVFIARNVGELFTTLTASSEAIKQTVKSIKENKIAHPLFLILLPLLVEVKNINVGAGYGET